MAAGSIRTRSFSPPTEGPHAAGTDPSMRAVVCLDGLATDAVLPVVLAAEFLIAADGGAHLAARAGRLPDLLVGDLDSLTAREVEALAERGVPVLRVERDK